MADELTQNSPDAQVRDETAQPHPPDDPMSGHTEPEQAVDDLQDMLARYGAPEGGGGTTDINDLMAEIDSLSTSDLGKSQQHTQTEPAQPPTSAPSVEPSSVAEEATLPAMDPEAEPAGTSNEIETDPEEIIIDESPVEEPVAEEPVVEADVTDEAVAESAQPEATVDEPAGQADSAQLETSDDEHVVAEADSSDEPQATEEASDPVEAEIDEMLAAATAQTKALDEGVAGNSKVESVVEAVESHSEPELEPDPAVDASVDDAVVSDPEPDAAIADADVVGPEPTESSAGSDEPPTEGIEDVLADIEEAEAIEPMATTGPVAPAEAKSSDAGAESDESIESVLADVEATSEPAETESVAAADVATEALQEQEVQPVAAEAREPAAEGAIDSEEVPQGEQEATGFEAVQLGTHDAEAQAEVDAAEAAGSAGSAPEAAASPEPEEEHQPEAPPDPALADIDAALSDDVDTLLLGDFSSVENVLDDIFDDKALIVQDEEDSPAVVNVARDSSSPSATIDLPINEEDAARMAAEKVAATGGGVLEQLDIDLDGEIETVDDRRADTIETQIPVADGPEPGMDEDDDQDTGVSAARRSSVIELLKEYALPLLAHIKPYAMLALLAINYPLRLLPPRYRDVIDWLALSLVFWVPIVWVLILFVL